MNVSVRYLMVWLCCAGVAGADSFESRVPRSETTGENFLSSSLINEQRYVFTSDDDGLKEHSLWIEGRTPRCSPKRAMKVSINWINKSLKIVDSKEMHWECCSVRLRKADENIWFWVVDYEYMPRAGMTSGIPLNFSVPVLADGTVPKVRTDQVRPDESNHEH